MYPAADRQSPMQSVRDSRSLVSHWLGAAGQEAGVSLCVADDGHCRILLDEGDCCVVEVPSDSELVYFYLAVRRIAQDGAEARRELQQALKLNAFGLETGCCAFAFDPRSDHLVLTCAAKLDALDEALFCAALDDFIGSALQAKARFDEELRLEERTGAAQPLFDNLAHRRV
jgi:hypothetical protein